MLNIDKMSPDDRYKVTTLFIKNIGKKVEAKLTSSEGVVGEKIEGELEGYKNDHIIVRVKLGSAKKSTKRILWPFEILEDIHFPKQVT